MRTTRAMNKALTILIGFVHDFSAGCWAATVLAIYWLSTAATPAGLEAALGGLKRQFFFLGLGCVALVLATGAGRTFTYVKNVYGPDAERTRRKMLVVKHVFLLAVFGLGTIWQYTMVY
jgi:putative copper export protein